jgi:prolyl-tRNA editing enzyme YbaK/EbsC (Cys-tRNA(Pro) deacylase)
VPPWGWATAPARTVIDRDLLGYEEIWAAAGTPRSVFPLSPSQLIELTGGDVEIVSVQRHTAPRDPGIYLMLSRSRP